MSAIQRAAVIDLSWESRLVPITPITPLGRFRRAARLVIHANRFIANTRATLEANASANSLMQEIAYNCTFNVLSYPIDVVVWAAEVSMMRGDSALFEANYYQGMIPTLRGLLTGGGAGVRPSAVKGLSALFRGVAPGFALSFFEDFVPDVKPVMQDDFQYSDTEFQVRRAVTFLRDALPRMAVCCLTRPFAVVALRMAVLGGDKYSSVSSTVSTISKNEGFTGFFKGGMMACVASLFEFNVIPGVSVRLCDFLTPVSLLTTLHTCDERRHVSTWQIASDVVEKHGFMGLIGPLRPSLAALPAVVTLGALVYGVAAMTIGLSDNDSNTSLWARMMTAIRLVSGGGATSSGRKAVQTDASTEQ